MHPEWQMLFLSLSKYKSCTASRPPPHHSTSCKKVYTYPRFIYNNHATLCSRTLIFARSAQLSHAMRSSDPRFMTASPCHHYRLSTRRSIHRSWHSAKMLATSVPHGIRHLPRDARNPGKSSNLKHLASALAASWHPALLEVPV
jgi:hypothetical protein